MHQLSGECEEGEGVYVSYILVIRYYSCTLY